MLLLNVSCPTYYPALPLEAVSEVVDQAELDVVGHVFRFGPIDGRISRRKKLVTGLCRELVCDPIFEPSSNLIGDHDVGIIGGEIGTINIDLGKTKPQPNVGLQRLSYLHIVIAV